jgi:hypothetical protein
LNFKNCDLKSNDKLIISTFSINFENVNIYKKTNRSDFKINSFNMEFKQKKELVDCKFENLSIELENLKLHLINEKENFHNSLTNKNELISQLKIQLADLSYEKELMEVDLKMEIKRIKYYLEKYKIF